MIVLVALVLIGASADSPNCNLCHSIVNKLNQKYKTPVLMEKPSQLFMTFCLKLKGMSYYEVCSGLVQEFQYLVQNNLADKLLDADFLCQGINACNRPKYISEDFDKYIKDVMKGKPSGPGPQATGSQTFKFVHLTDIHLDLQYTEGTVSDCGLPQCCRTGTGTPGNTAGYWGGRVCDLPARTLDASIDQIKALNPDFILLTGDVPPHDTWRQSKEMNILYDHTVAQTFLSAFPSTPIYVIYGNHECYPTDQCSFDSSNYWLPKPFTEHWGLGDDVRISLEQNAGYSVKHKNTNLRILVLDTNVFNIKNIYLMNNSTNVKGVLDWVYNQLLYSEKNNEQVYILGHIPPGDSSALAIWSKHFNVLVDRFEYTIAGLFFGHTHNDELHVHKGMTNIPTKVQWVAPSLTTYAYLNPSFRLFTADQDTKQLLDFTQYRLNLDNANLLPEVSPVWDAAYSFKDYYGLNDISAKSVYSLALRMGTNAQLSLKYLYNFYAGGLLAPNNCDSKCQSQNSCKMIFSDYESVLKCQGMTEQGIIYKVLSLLFNDWAYKIN